MVDYESLIPILTAAIQEQQKLISTQKSDSAKLRAELEIVRSRLAKQDLLIAGLYDLLKT